jgi:protein SFI1
VRWRSKLHEMEALQGRADEFVVMKEGRVVDRCWDEWRRTTELRSAERIIAEKVGARVVRESVVLWRQRTYACLPF